MQAPALVLPPKGPPVRLCTWLLGPRLCLPLAHPGPRPGCAEQQRDERAGPGICSTGERSPGPGSAGWGWGWGGVVGEEAGEPPCLLLFDHHLRVATVSTPARQTVTSTTSPLGLLSWTWNRCRSAGPRLCPPKPTGKWGSHPFWKDPLGALGTVAWLPGLPAVPSSDRVTSRTQAAHCGRKSLGVGVGKPGSPRTPWVAGERPLPLSGPCFLL